MTKIAFTPAVTKTEVVEVEPATLQITITAKQAQMLAGLIGHLTCGKEMWDIYDVLASVLETNNIEIPWWERPAGCSYNDEQLLGN